MEVKENSPLRGLSRHREPLVDVRPDERDHGPKPQTRDQVAEEHVRYPVHAKEDAGVANERSEDNADGPRPPALALVGEDEQHGEEEHDTNRVAAGEAVATLRDEDLHERGIWPWSGEDAFEQRREDVAGREDDELGGEVAALAVEEHCGNEQAHSREECGFED